MRFLTRPTFLTVLATTLAGVALMGCAIGSVGAQPSAPPRPAPGAPLAGDPPGAPGMRLGQGPAFPADFVERLAANLGLPVDTVRGALQQIQPEMPALAGQPPMPPAQDGSFGPGGPGGPGEFRGPWGPPPGPDGAGDFRGRSGGPGSIGGPQLDDLASRLAMALSVPEETVHGALQQTLRQMQPDQPPGRPIPEAPAAP